MEGAGGSRWVLDELPGRLAVCRLPAGAPIPDLSALESAAFACAVQVRHERALILPEGHAPPGAQVEAGWVALAVRGPLPFTAVGVLAELAGALAAAGIPILAMSSFDTDVLLVRFQHRAAAGVALRAHGHEVFLIDVSHQCP